MARITVDLPERVLHSETLAVQVGDVNYGSHLANDAVLRMCHEVRMRWLAAHGCSEPDIGGAGLIMADAAAQYLAQAWHGDLLQIDMGAADISGSRFSLIYHIHRISDGISIAKVQTGMACFDYQTQRVCRINPTLKTLLEAV